VAVSKGELAILSCLAHSCGLGAAVQDGVHHSRLAKGAKYLVRIANDDIVTQLACTIEGSRLRAYSTLE
jgi:hypothetical protein